MKTSKSNIPVKPTIIKGADNKNIGLKRILYDVVFILIIEFIVNVIFKL